MKHETRQLTRGVLVATALFTIAVGISILPIITLVGDATYRNNVHVFVPLLLGTSILCLSAIPHNLLYAQGKDRAIISATMLSIAVSIVMNYLLVPGMGALGSGIAYLLGVTVLLSTEALALYIQNHVNSTVKPSRISRRLQHLRSRSHEKQQKILP